MSQNDQMICDVVSTSLFGVAMMIIRLNELNQLSELPVNC